VDLAALQAQFRGRRFGELILHHLKHTDFQATVVTLLALPQELPQDARPLVESWIDEMSVPSRSEQFWQRDCGDVFASIIAVAAAKLRVAGIEPSSDDLFNMFQIIVFNFVYATHRFPQSKAFIQKSLGVGFLGRLLG